MNNYIYNCAECKIHCDGKSKGVYNFENDVNVSEEKENRLILEINKRNIVKARKCTISGFPDVELLLNDKIVALMEVKFQRRTFMLVKKYLPESDLIPSETVALNQSDLLRYFDINKQEKMPFYIIWGLEKRPCILPDDNVMFFYQNIEKLEFIYNKYKDKRKYRRLSGSGDVVDGIHKGVLVNWHFSLAELMPFNIDDFLSIIYKT